MSDPLQIEYILSDVASQLGTAQLGRVAEHAAVITYEGALFTLAWTTLDDADFVTLRADIQPFDPDKHATEVLAAMYLNGVLSRRAGLPVWYGIDQPSQTFCIMCAFGVLDLDADRVVDAILLLQRSLEAHPRGPMVQALRPAR